MKLASRPPRRTARDRRPAERDRVAAERQVRARSCGGRELRGHPSPEVAVDRGAVDEHKRGAAAALAVLERAGGTSAVRRSPSSALIATRESSQGTPALAVATLTRWPRGRHLRGSLRRAVRAAGGRRPRGAGRGRRLGRLLHLGPHAVSRARARRGGSLGDARRHGDGDGAGAIGPLVTPLARRRATSSRARRSRSTGSRGAAHAGRGLGSDRNGEFDPRAPRRGGRSARPREAARPGLERLARTGRASSSRRRCSSPRIPVWVACRWPNRRPLGARRAGTASSRSTSRARRAGRDRRRGAIAPPARRRRALRARGRPIRPAPTSPWVAAGATWCLTGFGLQPELRGGREAIDDRG